jgi:hypothetical protein
MDLAPWGAPDNSFSQSQNREHIAQTMRYVKNEHVALTLVAAGGDAVLHSLALNITEGELQIDKPLEWAGAIDSFRVFFRDMRQRWNFFAVSGAADNPFSLSIPMPETIWLLQRRSCNRIKVPCGTRALVKKADAAMATVLVHDLSAAGMLMYNDQVEGEYAMDSVINDIIVSIPSPGAAGEVGLARKVLPLIGQGRIVRAFVDPQTRRRCYGVSFSYESNYVRESINQVVAEVERKGLANNSSAFN